MSLRILNPALLEELPEAVCLDMDNTLENPSAIAPRETSFAVGGEVVDVELEPGTFAIYIVGKN